LTDVPTFGARRAPSTPYRIGSQIRQPSGRAAHRTLFIDPDRWKDGSGSIRLSHLIRRLATCSCIRPSASSWTRTTRSDLDLASHCGASRFAYNWGLALVKDRLDRQSRIREAAFRELCSDEDTEGLVNAVVVPWTMYALRSEWNREKFVVAPWWQKNSKFAYESGLALWGKR